MILWDDELKQRGHARTCLAYEGMGWPCDCGAPLPPVQPETVHIMTWEHGVQPGHVVKVIAGTGKGYHRVTSVESACTFNIRAMRFWEVGWMHLCSGWRWLWRKSLHVLDTMVGDE